MKKELKEVIEKFKEVSEQLKKFESRDQAIKYLVQETDLSQEECSNAYDCIVSIDGKKQ